MNQLEESMTQKLFEKELITSDQFQKVKNYRSLGIFSLHNELLFLVYLSVLLFTSGIGTLIYKNIDTIGHTIILALILIVTVVCFYFCFKNSKGFERGIVLFESPIYDYLVLLATILSCIFMGYLQFQYNLFGGDYSLTTVVCALIGFSFAYYFDNKSALTIGITALAATIGITVTPKTLLNNDIYNDANLSYYGLVLSLLLIVWTIYATQINLKKHFNVVFMTYALHLMLICCIAGLLDQYWFVFAFLFIGVGYYFFKNSIKTDSTFNFVFTLVYSYIGFNILMFKLFEVIDLSELSTLIILGMPLYLIGSIFLFIKLIKKFNKREL